MRESPIERHLVKQAAALGGEVRKVKWIGRRGAPDRFVMFPRFSFWAELKATDGVLEPHQQREHDRMKRMGQSVVVLASLDAVDIALQAALNTSRTMQLILDGAEGNA